VWCKEIRFPTTSTLGSSGTQAGAGAQQQPQTVAGTPRPVGQVTSSATTDPSPGPTIGTGSTNAAIPTQSGPVQPLNPLDKIGVGGELPFLIPE
jgi:hypothetical protein